MSNFEIILNGFLKMLYIWGIGFLQVAVICGIAFVCYILYLRYNYIQRKKRKRNLRKKYQ